MTWVRLDDDFPSHRKTRRLSDGAFRLHVSGLCWASRYLTDGHVPAEDLYMLTDLDEHLDPQVYRNALDSLIAAGVWHGQGHDCPRCPQVESGWYIHDYLEMNPSAEAVRRQRAQAAERQRRSRNKSRDLTDDGGDETDADVTHQSQFPTPTPTPTPTPDVPRGSLRSPRGARRNRSAEQIVIDNTDATTDEASAVVARVIADRQPRSVVALLRTMVRDGDLPAVLEEHRSARRSATVRSELDHARDGPACEHGEPGGGQAHPVSGEPLCPLCRAKRRRAAA